MESKCVICGEERAVDRAHIIPKRIVHQVERWEKFEEMEGKHIVHLCRNHHFLFDNFRLNDDEWKMLVPYLNEFSEELDEFLNSVLRSKKNFEIYKNVWNEETYNFRVKEHERKVRDFETWKQKLGRILCKYASWTHEPKRCEPT